MDATDRLIALALDEDLATSGDVTSLSVLDANLVGRAKFLAKDALVLAGLDAATRVFRAVDPTIVVRFTRVDGDAVGKGDVFGEVSGPARSLLTAERPALNFIQRLSGVATLTRKCVDALAGTKTKLIDTRKTTPGLRQLEKAAVRAGGGMNHRIGLFDGVLIKDNHIAACGSITQAITRAKAYVHPLMKVECEVVDLAGLDEAIAAGADMVLLDNMDDAQLAVAVKRAAGRVKLEASGNMSLERLPRVGATGVDFVSMGAITHSARAVDISLEMEPFKPA
ncbi:MAG: carboxylating nicotinate-nucleotide diphosphorylase [Deltaproteobacteria bacterium]|nr:carboxylating nicotinate-nucleotide diphosphorylase [Deltaproteobacteria bacterium]